MHHLCRLRGSLVTWDYIIFWGISPAVSILYVRTPFHLNQLLDLGITKQPVLIVEASLGLTYS